MIILSNLSKSFDTGRSYVVNDVSMQINPGELIVIVGASGSGKTTLMKMINRLIKPTSGEITIDGKNAADIDSVTLRRNIGYVFQQVGLFPHMTIADNVTIVLRLLKIPLEQRLEKARELLSFVNLDPDIYLSRMPAELSGGQQQRVGVARALANDPNILLMDEPFGALDPVNRDALQADLLALQQRLHKTIVFVTHDIFEALRLADRIVVMRGGKIQQIGTKQDILQHPANQYVKDFFATAAEQVAQHGEDLV